MKPRKRTKLELWMRENRYSDAAFAAAVEAELRLNMGHDETISARAVTKWRLGGPDAPVPRKHTLQAIYTVTNGEVDANSFADLPGAA